MINGSGTNKLVALIASSKPLPCSEGRAREVILGRHNSDRRAYDIGWWSADHVPRPRPPLRGRGWHVAYRVIQYEGPNLFQFHEDLREGGSKFFPTADIDDKRSNGTFRWQSIPELLIYAPDLSVARRAANLIVASYALLDGQILVTDEATPLPLDPAELAALPTWQQYRECEYITTSYMAEAAALAAKVSHRRNHTYAALKYFQSLRCASVPWIETDPRHGKQYHIEKDPFAHVLFAQAIILAYSCIEELGLETRPSPDNPTFISGTTWNPRVKQDLEARLSAAGVDVNENFNWTLRGTPTRIERKGRKLTGRKASWAKYEVRDQDLPLINAIAQARWLRHKVSAHKLSDLARSLTIYDVSNVQFLARRLILETTGQWKRIEEHWRYAAGRSGKHKGAKQEPTRANLSD